MHCAYGCRCSIVIVHLLIGKLLKYTDEHLYDVNNMTVGIIHYFVCIIKIISKVVNGFQKVLGIDG